MSPWRAASFSTVWPACPEWLAISPRLARVPSHPRPCVRVDGYAVSRYYCPCKYVANRLSSVRDAEAGGSNPPSRPEELGCKRSLPAPKGTSSCSP